ncbi:hypothetical protein [Campylobacter gastrosuis]|uniref:Uncharacterized protein n=1 Tax=Campylobacter gastrosuis TaxID=2974576 RepID=A0ABT7HQ36_9BACT|nr:hypothetical protein [Campylobacter gastrosuis]MDL0088832.1 hypothetical protein [Campylobacter gastrosuis]
MQTITITTSNPNPQIAQAISAFMQIIDPTHEIEYKNINKTTSKKDIDNLKELVTKVESGDLKCISEDEFKQQMRKLLIKLGANENHLL